MADTAATPDASTSRAVIDHAGVSVADLERSERFYRDVLGFTTAEDRFAFPEHDLRGVVLAQPPGRPGRAVRAQGLRAYRPPPPDRVHPPARLVPVRPGRTGHRRDVRGRGGSRSGALSRADHGPGRGVPGRLRAGPRRQSCRIPATASPARSPWIARHVGRGTARPGGHPHVHPPARERARVRRPGPAGCDAAAPGQGRTRPGDRAHRRNPRLLRRARGPG
jgi:catechol 2,3-dioxygenase-like lactoylglutathione lyase family enzyme